MLPVGGECVQVSNFLESKRNDEAVGDGDIHRLFYEFTGDEDLDSYREVVTATSNVRLFFLNHCLSIKLYGDL